MKIKVSSLFETHTLQNKKQKQEQTKITVKTKNEGIQMQE